MKAQYGESIIISDTLAQNRFNAAKRDIEREPCLHPLQTTVWATVEGLPMNPYYRWREVGNGVLFMARE